MVSGRGGTRREAKLPVPADTIGAVVHVRVPLQGVVGVLVFEVVRRASACGPLTRTILVRRLNGWKDPSTDYLTSFSTFAFRVP